MEKNWIVELDRYLVRYYTKDLSCWIYKIGFDKRMNTVFPAQTSRMGQCLVKQIECGRALT